MKFKWERISDRRVDRKRRWLLTHSWKLVHEGRTYIVKERNNGGWICFDHTDKIHHKRPTIRFYGYAHETKGAVEDWLEAGGWGADLNREDWRM